MKPTRGPGGSSWLQMWSKMPKQRRSSWLTLVALVVTFCLLVLYQRYMTANPAPLDLSDREMPGTTAGGAPNPATAGTGTEVPDLTPAETGDPEAATEALADAKGAALAEGTPRTLALPVTGQEARGYAHVWSEALQDWRWHTGVDFRAPVGTPVKAAAAGEVISVEQHPLDGLTIAIDHGNGLTTRYAGLQDPLVAKGARVTEGQAVGRIGDPGPAEAEMGPHLHFEVLENGEPVDPMALIP